MRRVVAWRAAWWAGVALALLVLAASPAHSQKKVRLFEIELSSDVPFDETVKEDLRKAIEEKLEDDPRVSFKRMDKRRTADLEGNKRAEYAKELKVDFIILGTVRHVNEESLYLDLSLEDYSSGEVTHPWARKLHVPRNPVIVGAVIKEWVREMHTVLVDEPLRKLVFASCFQVKVDDPKLARKAPQWPSSLSQQLGKNMRGKYELGSIPSDWVETECKKGVWERPGLESRFVISVFIGPGSEESTVSITVNVLAVEPGNRPQPFEVYPHERSKDRQLISDLANYIWAKWKEHIEDENGD